MNENKQSGAKTRASKKWIIGIVLILVTIVAFSVTQILAPRPSITAYCKVYGEEKNRLSKLPGSTWSSAVFDQKLSDAGEFATSFSRLEQVAPSDIKPDITTLKSVYQKIHDDPSQAMSASLSGITAEKNVQKWTQSNCQSLQ